MNSFKSAPFFRIAIAFICGILLQHHLNGPWKLLLAIMGILIILILLYRLLPLKHQFFYNRYEAVLFWLTLLLVGSLVYQHKVMRTDHIDTNERIYYGTILDIPDEKDNSTGATVKITALEDSNQWYKSNLKILTYFQKDSLSQSLKPSDHLVFQTRVNRVKNYGNPGEFDYKRYLQVHGIRYQSYIPAENWKRLNSPAPFHIRAQANLVRMKLLQILKKSGIKDEEFAVASALILGYKDQLTQDTKQTFASSGATHILAVSGLHVGIIFFFFHYLFFFMESRKKTKVMKGVLILILLWVYAFLTGLSPSVSRASLMFSVIAVGSILKRDTSVYNSLAFSAFVLLMINPFLVFSVGFQLSYLAVLSIVFFQPRIYALLNLPVVPDKFWQWFTVALAAQLGTAPLVIYYFHQFPNYFWLTNFVAIPAAAGIVLTGFIYFIFYPLFTPVAMLAGWILEKIISLLQTILQGINKLPLAVSTGLSLDQMQALLLYTALLGLTLFLVKKKGKQVIWILTVLLLYLGWSSWQTNKNQQTEEFIIYNIPKQSVYNYIGKQKNLVFTNQSVSTKETLGFFTENYWIKRKAEIPEFITFNKDRTNNSPPHKTDFFQKGEFMNIGGLKIFSPSKRTLEHLPGNTRINIDYLVLSKHSRLNIHAIKEHISFRLVILDSSIPYYKKQKWLKTLREEQIPCYDVSAEGAFQKVIEPKFQ